MSSHQTVIHQKSHLSEVWKRCMTLGGESPEMTQSEFFKKYIPSDESDFTPVFLKFNLGEIFTSTKVCTPMRGSFNCNYLFRQVSEVPHILIYSDENYMAFQPLGEPGRDINNLKIGHIMVVNYNQSNLFTLNDMLPLSHSENEDLKEKCNFLKMAYNSLFKNMLVKDCGEMVRKKALKVGISETTPIREFLAYQILNIPKEIKDNVPGYKLMVDGSDISSHLQKVNSTISKVFNQKLKIGSFIQGPRFCSQLISHIHGFLFDSESVTFGTEFRKTYINVDHILVTDNRSLTPPRKRVVKRSHREENNRASTPPREPPKQRIRGGNSWCCCASKK